jgi:hypothetical protein
MDFNVEVGVRAYAKIILHAKKYPHCAVNGVLLAPKDQVSLAPRRDSHQTTLGLVFTGEEGRRDEELEIRGRDSLIPPNSGFVANDRSSFGSS